MIGRRIIDSDKALGALKKFQQATVAHAYRELYREGGSGRFLVADEVGLGKTIVARLCLFKFCNSEAES